MAGRKSKYETAVKPFLDEINKKVREGVIEEEIAKALGISVATLNNYKNKYPEFKEALSKSKGKDVLQRLINAGIESAIGYYKDEVSITEKDGVKVTTKTRKWVPANGTLNIFYVKNFGKEEGYTNDPLDYELKKAKAEFDQEQQKQDDWVKDL